METKTQESEIISADISENEVKKLIEENYDIIPENLCKLDGYDDLNFRILPPIKTKTNNGHTELCQHGYVLKIINWKSSMDIEFMSEYVNVLIHLRNQQITAPYPIKNNKGEYTMHWSKRDYNFKAGQENKGTNVKPLQRVHTVLLLEFIAGKLLEGLKIGEKLCFSIGQQIGRLHTTLEPFCTSKALHRPHFLWSLKYVSDVLKYTSAVDDEVKRTMATNAIEQFEENVFARLDELEQGIIHGDINKLNLLVPHNGENNEEIRGILDFSDMIHSSYLFEIAVAITYLSLDDSDRLEDIAASIILGYRRNFTELEFNLLKICICARLSQSLVLGLYSFKLHPTNTYLLITQKQGWPMLEKLRNIDNDQFIAKIKEKMAHYGPQFLP